MVGIVRVKLLHADDGSELAKSELSLALPKGGEVVPGNVKLALDCLGFGNPEPWTVLFIEEVQ